jgi:predicted transcriptional regulator
LEREIMQVCWQAGEPLSVRAVLDVLNRGRVAPLAYTTVMSVLTKLADKGLLARTPQGRRFLYTPTVADEAAIAVREVLRTYGEAAVAHFAEQTAADPDLRGRLRRLLEGST